MRLNWFIGGTAERAQSSEKYSRRVDSDHFSDLGAESCAKVPPINAISSADREILEACAFSTAC